MLDNKNSEITNYQTTFTDKKKFLAWKENSGNRKKGATALVLARIKTNSEMRPQ